MKYSTDMNPVDAHIRLAAGEDLRGPAVRPDRLTAEDVSTFLERIQEGDRLLDALFDQIVRS